MRIGEAAGQAGVNVQTLRYYERRGLLTAPRRSVSGYRTYAPDDVRAVRFIKHAQELGFTLADVEALLGLAKGEPRSCPVVRRLATQKIEQLDRKIAMLRAMRASLERLVKTCARPRRRRECPLLASLAEAAL
jgi:DNA-binding transcriptional MerR regulator